MSDKCKKCDKNIRSKAKVQCSDCICYFHGHCVNLSQDDIDFLISEKSIWRCDPCRNLRRASLRVENALSEETVSSVDVLKYLKEMREENKNQIKHLEDELGKSVDSCHDKIADLIKIIEEQSKTLKDYEKNFETLKQENVDLNLKVIHLESKVDELEQYSRTNCLEINGIPEEKSENMIELVKKIGNFLEVPLSEDDVDVCHRLGVNQEERHRGIIIKFVRRSMKEEFIRKRKIKRNFNSHDIGFTDRPNNVIYINESLSQPRRRILNEARALKKDKQYSFVWVKNGRIFLRKSEGDKAIVLTSIEQVAALNNK